MQHQKGVAFIFLKVIIKMMKPMVVSPNKIKLTLFIELYRLFNEHGFSLYMVGGTVRDYLMKEDLTDMDLVTNATPMEMKKFLLGEADYTFEKYGSVKLRYRQHKFDITTLRKEDGYIDARHPNKVVFSKSLEEDVKRRDFTVNALYMDHEYKVIDFVGGEKDLENKILKVVGDASIRIKEDPLRIVRALRFKINYGFIFDKELEKAVKENAHLLKTINIEKIKQEVSKCHDQEKLLEYLKHFNVL